MRSWYSTSAWARAKCGAGSSGALAHSRPGMRNLLAQGSLRPPKSSTVWTTGCSRVKVELQSLVQILSRRPKSERTSALEALRLFIDIKLFGTWHAEQNTCFATSPRTAPGGKIGFVVRIVHPMFLGGSARRSADDANLSVEGMSSVRTDAARHSMEGPIKRESRSSMKLSSAA